MIHLTEPGDPRLADYTDLTDVALRRVREPAEGLFIAESTQVIRHRGAIASMHRPTPPPLEQVLDGARIIAILEDLVDHTNVGACFRSAAGLGIDAVLVTPRCADPLYRRSIRVSMGTVFQVPWTRINPWPHALTTLREAGFHTAALALSADSIALEDFAAHRPQRLALILGTEGDGLAPATTTAADTVVRIPMDGGVDSLNVAAASPAPSGPSATGPPGRAEPRHVAARGGPLGGV